ncbi:MAG: dihydrolipoamide acetyltransferase family protein [Xanthomonadales bacterium]|nr:dihydrolipoamide acetyltransferase family protein [Xanthomonadales bacterium]
MSEYIFKLPDLGEGTVEAEIAAWHVAEGAHITEDDPLVDMMTDKASVEVASPVTGIIKTLHGEAGASVAVGAPLVTLEVGLEVDDSAAESTPEAAAAPEESAAASAPEPAPVAAAAAPDAGVAAASGKVLTSPSIRRMAREAGIDLTQIAGSGPKGRILRSDLEAAINGDAGPVAAPEPGTEEIKIIGVRRLIAQRMTSSKRNIPHYSYVEEVDITALEALRKHLNGKLAQGQPKLTYLPFIVMALTRVMPEFPQCNALHDAERETVVRYRAVHAGIATQTPQGLKVPVVRDTQTMNLGQLADAIRRVADRARDGSAGRNELTGSTITVTSLGKLGGIVTTPVINEPEVSIIGVNKAVERPMVVNGNIEVRLMMNLSGSFDHRFVDGFDAAAMIQSLKEHLEQPATIFMEGHL